MTIDICMVTFNRKEYTQNAIEYLNERTKTPFRLFVIDNCSTDGTQDLLNKFYDEGKVFRWLEVNKNSGIHAAHNIGLGIAKSDYYVSTDNDLYCADLEPDWLAQMIALMEKNPDYGAICCRPQALTGAMHIDENKEVTEFNHVGAHLRVHRIQATKESGGWLETWDALRNSEDKTISSALQAKGYKVGYARDIRCFHEFGVNWGYKEIKPHDHGHRIPGDEIWPPPENMSRPIEDYNDKTWEVKNG